MTDFQVVYVTSPNDEVSIRIAKNLVEQKLAACVNIVKGITSIYQWQGKLEEDEEQLLIIKTRGEKVEALIKKVKELHEYDVPEIIALPITDGYQPYLNWINDETS